MMSLTINTEKAIPNPQNPPSPGMLFEIDVALPLTIPQLFKYLSPSAIPQGCRVVVPFGTQKLQGICMAARQHVPEIDGARTRLDQKKGAKAKSFELKAIHERVDEQAFFSDKLLSLAQWLSTYYCHPIGDVLRSMAPSSQQKLRSKKWIRLESAVEEVVEAFSGRNSLADLTLRKKINQQTLRLWEKKAWITLEKTQRVKARSSNKDFEESQTTVYEADKKPLTQDQERVLNALIQSPTTQPQLLHGVTGAGKTEVYMRLIENARQALVLVPEISLTPQMTQVFKRRFGEKVEVVHSAMSPNQRFQALERVRSMQTRILIGPRSAVFAPFAALDLIIVDEEHDTSYKQSTGFCYHGRDVAIVRAKLEGARIVLGSATPSMESIYNANSAKYGYHVLDKAVFHSIPPTLKIVSSPQKMADRLEKSFLTQKSPAPGNLLHEDIVSELTATLNRNEQAMILINRRGHAFYVMSAKSQRSIQCPHCSVSLSLHGLKRWLHCHYCEYAKSVDELLREKEGEDIFFAVGYGSEQIESYLKETLVDARIARLDADVLENRQQLDKILGAFRTKEIDILVGTQILAKGHDFPDVTMVAILDADEMLQLPDFRSSERCFQLIVQAAGRVGRAGKASTIMVQTLQQDHPIIHDACQKNYMSFMQRELTFREEAGYPPFLKIAKIEIKSADTAKLNDFCHVFQDWLSVVAKSHPHLPQSMKLYGPTAPPLEVIRNQHRRMVLLKSSDPLVLRSFIHLFHQAFVSWEKKLKFQIDIDPQSLM
jgi:primosomal protein N' (replication factor Y) (superfamily II helicase)